jgi:hypothetical protein
MKDVQLLWEMEGWTRPSERGSFYTQAAQKETTVLGTGTTGNKISEAPGTKARRRGADLGGFEAEGCDERRARQWKSGEEDAVESIFTRYQ